MCLISMETRMFVEQLVLGNKKENTLVSVEIHLLHKGK